MRTFSGETVFLRIGGRVESGRDTEKLENILKAFGSGEYREVVKKHSIYWLMLWDEAKQ
jgi:hypothetical protein